MSALAGNGASVSAPLVGRRRLEVILFRGRKGEEEDAAVEREREPISGAGGGIQHVGLPN